MFFLKYWHNAEGSVSDKQSFNEDSDDTELVQHADWLQHGFTLFPE